MDFDEKGASLGLLISGIVVGSCACFALLAYLLKLRQRTSAGYRDYDWDGGMKVRKNINNLREGEFQSELSDFAFLHKMERRKSLMTAQSLGVIGRTGQLNLFVDFGGARYQMNQRCLRNDVITNGLEILKGTAIYEKRLQKLRDLYQMKETEGDEEDPEVPEWTDADLEYERVLERLVDDDETPPVYFYEGEFLFPYNVKKEKPYWESYENGICCDVCKESVLEGECSMSNKYWYAFRTRKAVCERCLPQQCIDPHVILVSCTGTDQTGNFEMYGVVEETSGNVVLYQRYLPGSRGKRNRQTGKVTVQLNYGHTTFIRLKPNGSLFQGWWTMESRSWEDCDRITLKEETQDYVSHRASVMSRQFSYISLSTMQDTQGHHMTVGTLQCKGSELIGFLEFDDTNYPTFTHTFSKTNERLLACAPNLCFAKISEGDRLLKLEDDDLWERSEDYIYDLLYERDLYASAITIQVDRGNSQTNHSTFRLMFEHALEEIPSPTSKRYSKRKSQESKRDPTDRKTNSDDEMPHTKRDASQTKLATVDRFSRQSLSSIGI